MIVMIRSVSKNPTRFSGKGTRLTLSAGTPSALLSGASAPPQAALARVERLSCSLSLSCTPCAVTLARFSVLSSPAPCRGRQLWDCKHPAAPGGWIAICDPQWRAHQVRSCASLQKERSAMYSAISPRMPFGPLLSAATPRPETRFPPQECHPQPQPPLPPPHPCDVPRPIRRDAKAPGSRPEDGIVPLGPGGGGGLPGDAADPCGTGRGALEWLRLLFDPAVFQTYTR